MKKKVFITRRIPEIGINLLKEQYDVKVFQGKSPIKRDKLIQDIQGMDGVITLLSDQMDDAVFNSAQQLKIVANYAVGYNNIDINAAKKYKVMVTNTPGVLTNATAEIAFALLITLTRKIISADMYTRKGKFTAWDPLLFLGDELKGKTIGILGMGRIGQDMAKKCRVFGMNIIYHNRKPVDKKTETALSATYRYLDEFLEESDIISVHTPLTRETRHLIDSKAFDRMKSGVYLINTSRGEVIDEKSMVTELQKGKVKGAGLDVYEFEPKINKELFAMNNVVLLPHIGSATVETRNKMSEMAAKNVITALGGGKPENLVPELKLLF